MHVSDAQRAAVAALAPPTDAAVAPTLPHAARPFASAVDGGAPVVDVATLSRQWLSLVPALRSRLAPFATPTLYAVERSRAAALDAVAPPLERAADDVVLDFVAEDTTLTELRYADAPFAK